MQKKLFYFIGIFSLIIFIFLIRLYYPTPLDDKKTSIAQVEEQNSMPWQVYTSDLFQVSLPGLPQHIKEKMPLTNKEEIINYDMYLVQQPVGSTFMISIIRYPDTMDTTDSKQILEAITNEMLSNNSESRLVSSTPGVFLDLPSLDNVIENSTLYVFMKAFISNKTLYVVNVVDGQKTRAKENFEKAINSFQIISTISH